MSTQEKPKEQKNIFKDTLNLPSTPFPMRANLAQNEPQRRKKWDKEGLYQAILDKNKDTTPFVFHDGPPYANGSIHVGHLLNKVLKDIVVRSQNAMGHYCNFIPGWDCHGLPIEHKVMTELVEKKADKLNSVDEDTRRMIIRNECKKYAEKFIKLQSEQMQQLLTAAHYKTPYLTMDPHYESRVLDVFASLVKEGIVYRQLKPVHWSLENQTALAEAELEYYDKEDTSVYVNFKLQDQAGTKTRLNTSVPDDIHVMIWTTTPWTLPANLGITIHQNYTYSLVTLDNKTTLVAKELIEKISSTIKKDITHIQDISGDTLIGLSYEHPFCNRTGKIAHGDYVTLEDGTGLVHTAPGHGIDDYQTGLREGLDVYCPVQANGTYDDTVPEWISGQHIWKANPIIVERLRKSGNLVHDYAFMHSYPHDWRSKTPVIFRSTEQWFIGVDKPLNTHKKSLRELALNKIENEIEFIPGWGQNRLRGMLEARPDWCLSRQRAWGLPIPAFRSKDGSILLTEASVRAISTVFRSEGSDAWFKKSPSELLAHYDSSKDPEAPQGIVIAELEKMFDIFDVWFESGSSWNAVLNERNIGYPADLYLEGSDQHRGWFHLSLLPALGVTGSSPFKRVLTHGFIVDKDGRKMSKSLGNTINVEDLLKKYGAEIARWWASSLSFENDIKVDMSYFDQAGDSYRKVRNTIRFLLSTVSDFDGNSVKTDTIQDIVNTIPTTSLEGYLLGQTAELIKNVETSYTTFKFKNAHTEIYNFCNETLSAFYCAAVKDRLYCDAQNSPRRRQSQKAMWIVLEVLARLLAPILPHSADEMYQALHNSNDVSVHLQNWITFTYASSPEWDQVLETRDTVLKALEEAKSTGIENNLDAGVKLSDNISILEAFKDDLADMFGVSQVHFDTDTNGVSVFDLKEAPRCERSWKRDGTVKIRSNNALLSDRDAAAIGVA